LIGILLVSFSVGVDNGSVDIKDSKFSCPAIIDNHDSPKAILGVTPPSQDGFAIKGDFVTSFVKKIPCSPRRTGWQQRGDC
jgi:hypothetical protein